MHYVCGDMAADWSFLGFNLATQPSTVKRMIQERNIVNRQRPWQEIKWFPTRETRMEKHRGGSVHHQEGECLCQSTTDYGPSRSTRMSELRISGVAPKCLMGATIHGRMRKKRPCPEGERWERTDQYDCREAHNKRGRSLRGAAVKQVAKENAQSDGTATAEVADCSPLPLAYGRCFEGVVPHHPQLDQDLNATRSSNNGRVRRLLGGRRWECSGG